MIIIFFISTLGRVMNVKVKKLKNVIPIPFKHKTIEAMWNVTISSVEG